MSVPGREEVTEYVLGTGLIKEKSKIDRVSIQAIEEDTLDTLLTENIFYPESILSHPFGPDGPKYTHRNVT